jgi:hypothetical protein
LSWVEVRPEWPITAAQGPVAAEVDWAGTRVGDFVVVVNLRGPEGARITRAALLQPNPTVCPADPARCAERLSLAMTARVSGGGSRFVLAFPLYGTKEELARKPELLLEVTTKSKESSLLVLDLSRAEFQSGDWGIGGAVRYRPPGLINSYFGHAVTAELGADRWLGATRLRLDYEMGFTNCPGTTVVEYASCIPDETLVPAGGALSATHYVNSGPVSFGVGAGYGVFTMLARDDAAESDLSGSPPLLHGPRLSLLTVAAPPRLPRFSLEPPKTAAGLELSLELLGHHGFEEPSVVAGIAYSMTAEF